MKFPNITFYSIKLILSVIIYLCKYINVSLVPLTARVIRTLAIQSNTQQNIEISGYWDRIKKSIFKMLKTWFPNVLSHKENFVFIRIIYKRQVHIWNKSFLHCYNFWIDLFRLVWHQFMFYQNNVYSIRRSKSLMIKLKHSFPLNDWDKH